VVGRPQPADLLGRIGADHEATVDLQRSPVRTAGQHEVDAVVDGAVVGIIDELVETEV
jgi:microcompartment protein CcmK/EutM